MTNKKIILPIIGTIIAIVIGIIVSIYVRDIYLFEDAMTKNNENYCLKIFNNKTKEVCINNIAVIKNDVKICSLLKDEKKTDLCYFDIGITNKLQSACGLIKIENSRNICIDANIINQAILSNDIKKCDEITQESGNAYCKKQFLN